VSARGEGGRILDRTPALRTAGADEGRQTPTADTVVWESDLADLATMPFTEADSLAPLPPTARILQEVLRSRGGIRSGGGQPGRAE
jgi:hypothetical protein